MKRSLALVVAVGFLAGELAWPLANVQAESAPVGEPVEMDLFDAMQGGVVEAKFIARDSQRGRIVVTNKTPNPVSVVIPDAFIGVPQVQAQFGGGGMGGGMGGMGGGGQQSVGGGRGGGGGGRGGGGRGGGFGGGRGGGGGRRGGFSIPPEKVVRVDVPLVCLDHGLKDPSSSKPYTIQPIENHIKDPAVIAIVSAYAAGDLPPGAAQAAVWNLNSGVGWDELAAKQTGTDRNIVREPYFSGEELDAAVAIVNEARIATVDQVVEPREFKLPGEADDKAKVVIESKSADEAEEANESGAEEPEAGESSSKPAEAEVAAAG